MKHSTIRQIPTFVEGQVLQNSGWKRKVAKMEYRVLKQNKIVFLF
jgi:hypothetical protein